MDDSLVLLGLIIIIIIVNFKAHKLIIIILIIIILYTSCRAIDKHCYPMGKAVDPYPSLII